MPHPLNRRQRRRVVIDLLEKVNMRCCDSSCNASRSFSLINPAILLSFWTGAFTTELTPTPDGEMRGLNHAAANCEVVANPHSSIGISYETSWLHCSLCACGHCQTTQSLWNDLRWAGSSWSVCWNAWRFCQTRTCLQTQQESTWPWTSSSNLVSSLERQSVASWIHPNDWCGSMPFHLSQSHLCDLIIARLMVAHSMFLSLKTRDIISQNLHQVCRPWAKWVGSHLNRSVTTVDDITIGDWMFLWLRCNYLSFLDSWFLHWLFRRHPHLPLLLDQRGDEVKI